MKLIKNLFSLILFYISGIIKRDSKKIIFGAWFGEKYSDNPKYFCEYLLNSRRDLTLIWCGNEEVRESIDNRNIIFVKKGSFKALYYSLTSKYVFFSHSYRDISEYNLFKGAKLVQLWHGVGIKNIGADMNKNENNKLVVKVINSLKQVKYKIIDSYDFFICSSNLNMQRNISAFKNNNINKKNTIKSGQPRNDFLINYKNNVNIYNKIRKDYKIKYNIPLDKKIISYLPTFRDKGTKALTLNDLELKNKEKIEYLLKDNNYIFLEKNHFVDLERNNNTRKNESSYIFNIGKYTDIDTQELLFITDILITDYSSCMFDFLLLDRPIIHLIEDYEEYTSNDRGLYYDLMNLLSGPIAKNLDELIEKMENCINDSYYKSDLRSKVRKEMMSFELGNSCVQIEKHIDI